MYHVIYSEDPYLLARMCTELQMEGYNVDLPWCDKRNPFGDQQSEVRECTYLHIDDDNEIGFYSTGNCSLTPPETRHTLTESNYLTVLKSVVCEK